MRPEIMGMKVRSRDGAKLGKVVATGNKVFTIEKGIFFTDEYLASYDDIESTGDGEVRLRLGKDELLAREAPLGDLGEQAASTDMGSSIAKETVSVPLSEEELQARKQMTEVGEVRIKKEVRTEQKTITVPVSKESVVVERVAAEPGKAPAENAFKEGEVRIPIHEERVEVTKRPVVKEEVRVGKQVRTDEQKISETVRKEEARVEGTGEVERLKGEPRPSH